MSNSTILAGPLNYTAFGKTYQVYVEATIYAATGGLALYLSNEISREDAIDCGWKPGQELPREHFMTASVCLPQEGKLARGTAFIKDYSGNEGVLDWLISHKILEDMPLMVTCSGYVSIELYRLTPEMLKKLEGEQRA